MDARLDPRLRATPSSSTTGGLTQLPALPHASLADNPGRLPPPTRSQLPLLPETHRQPYYHQPSLASPTVPSAQSPLTSVKPGGGLDPKRPRACEACRGLKVRCDSDSSNLDGPCKRCAKAGRDCVVTVPTRKRQKKTDSRVAELEKKIDALTASLHATRSETDTRPSDGGTPSQDADDVPGLGDGAWMTPRDSPENVRPSPSAAPRSLSWSQQLDPRLNATPPRPERKTSSTLGVSALKRKHSGDGHSSKVATSLETRAPAPPQAMSQDRGLPAREKVSSVHSFLIPKPARDGQPSMVTSDSPTVQANVEALQYEHADVIDRRMISSELANIFFDRYVKHMAPQFPAVVFPAGTTAAEIRKTKPTLFLAILSVGACTSHPDVQKTLTKEIMKVLATRVMCNGEKSLEIIQALHVVTIWYWPPEHYDELKYYQLTHIAAVMAIDLNIGRRQKPLKPRSGGPSFWRENPWKRQTQSNPESAEARRAWLTCYFLCAKYGLPSIGSSPFTAIG